MPVENPPDIWALLFDQTPRALRWLFGICTLGIFTFASMLYRWNRADMRRVEDRIDRLESRLDRQMAEQTRILTEIAVNTGRHHEER